MPDFDGMKMLEMTMRLARGVRPAAMRWIVVCSALIIGATATASAQQYPNRPVTIIVSAAPGGVTDLLARNVAQSLSHKWGQQVIVENRSGAARNIAAGAVSNAAPDGYTLLVSEGGTFVINRNLLDPTSPPLNPEDDLVPVSGLAKFYLSLVAHPSLGVSSVKDLLALGRQKPGQITYATTGIAGASHTHVLLLESLTGVKFLPVHYRGGALALNDLVGGHISFMALSVSLTSGPSKSGAVKMLGVGSPERLPQIPDVPTVGETVPGYAPATWVGLFAPKAMPEELIKRINADVQSVLPEAEFNEGFLAKQVLVGMPGTPQEFSETIKRERAMWTKTLAGTGTPQN